MTSPPGPGAAATISGVQRTARTPHLRAVLLGALAVLTTAGCAQRPGELLATGAPRRSAVGVTRVRVLSLNTWLLPGFSKQMAQRLARMPAAIRAESPDVICLQEVWLPTTRDGLAEQLGPEYAATEERRGGLVTLSRWPIVAQEFVPFPVVEGMSTEERLAGKGLLLSVLDAPGGRLRVVNTHLAHQRGPNRAHIEALRAQVARLDDLPLVLAGDLNHALGMRPLDGSLEYADWCGLGFCHADPIASGRWGDRIRGEPPPRVVPTRPGWPPEERGGWAPDHVLVRDSLWRTVSPRSYRVLFTTPAEALSDHRGLLVDLELAP